MSANSTVTAVTSGSRVRVAAEDSSSFPPVRSATVKGVTYRMGHQIGRGAFSKVFGGDDSLGRRLAVKVMSADADRALWTREVRALSRLRGPGIVQLCAAFEHEGFRYLVMEHAGISVDRLGTERGRQLFGVLAAGLLSALHRVHRAGFVHGDVCPGNLLVLDALRAPSGAQDGAQDGSPSGSPSRPPSGAPAVRLADFAFCRLQSDAPSPTEMVPFWQAAPEDLAPESFGQAGAAKDIYMAALVFLRLATGVRRQYGRSEVLAAQPRQDALALDSPAGSVLARALAPEPDERPGAAALWTLLRDALRPPP